MSGAESALEGAVLELLAASEAVTALLGEPVRVLDEASAKPAHPYLEIVRHEIQPVGGAGAEAEEHRIDLAIVSREPGRDAMREVLAAVRAAVNGGEVTMAGWRCVLLLPVFADMMRTKFGGWRALLRLKAVVEPA